MRVHAWETISTNITTGFSILSQSIQSCTACCHDHAGGFLAQPPSNKGSRARPLAQRRAPSPPHRRKPLLRHRGPARDLPDSNAAPAPRNESPRRQASLGAGELAFLHPTVTPATATNATGNNDQSPSSSRSPPRGTPP